MKYGKTSKKKRRSIAVAELTQAIQSPCQKPTTKGGRDKLQSSKPLEQGYVELKCPGSWTSLAKSYTTNICASRPYIAKKVLECYDGIEKSVKVNKVLMWMGPEGCVKHEIHPFPPGDKEKLTPLWNFFDNLFQEGR